VLGVKFQESSPQTHLVVSSGTISLPIISDLQYAKPEGSLGTIIESHETKSNGESNVGGLDTIGGEHHMLGPSDKGARGNEVDFTLPVSKRQKADPAGNLTIAERLEAMAASLALPDLPRDVSKTPKGESLVSVLEQALQSHDDSLLEECLVVMDAHVSDYYHSLYLSPTSNCLIFSDELNYLIRFVRSGCGGDRKSIIIHTCAAVPHAVSNQRHFLSLSPSLSLSLIYITTCDRLSEKVERSPTRGLSLCVWMRSVFTKHSSYLMSVPNLHLKLASLYQILDDRASVFPKLLNLNGRLELALSQISPSEKTSDEELAHMCYDEKIDDALAAADGENDDDDDDEDEEEEY
jgi:hypothetical protein